MGLSGVALVAVVIAAGPDSLRSAVELGIASEARSRTVDVPAQPRVLSNEAEVRPLVRLALAHRIAEASVEYEPRLLAGDQEPRAIQQGRARLAWRPDRTWSVRADGSFVYGVDSRPGVSAQPAPGVAIEVSPIQLVRYTRWDAGATLEVRPARRWRLGANAAWVASGGVGASAALMPTQEGPQARVSASWDASRRDVLGALLNASASSVAGAPDVGVASMEARWARHVARDVDAELAAGAGGARSADGALSSALPTGRAALRIAWPGQARAEAAAAAETSIVVDRYSGTVESRHEARASGGWSGQGGWWVGGRAIGALLADRGDVQSRVGAFEVSAGYRLARSAMAMAGARFTWQRSVVATVPGFTEWNVFVAVAASGLLDIGHAAAPEAQEAQEAQGERR